MKQYLVNQFVIGPTPVGISADTYVSLGQLGRKRVAVNKQSFWSQRLDQSPSMFIETIEGELLLRIRISSIQ